MMGSSIYGLAVIDELLYSRIYGRCIVCPSTSTNCGGYPQIVIQNITHQKILVWPEEWQHLFVFVSAAHWHPAASAYCRTLKPPWHTGHWAHLHQQFYPKICSGNVRNFFTYHKIVTYILQWVSHIHWNTYEILKTTDKKTVVFSWI